MSKELDAFYKIKDKLIKVEGNTTYGSITDLTNLDIIETALEDYQLHKEILNDYGFTLVNFREACFLLAQFRGIGYTGIENKLKALKIILEKEIDIPLLKESDSVEDYNYWCSEGSQLELEQYTLLKERLKNERL